MVVVVLSLRSAWWLMLVPVLLLLYRGFIVGLLGVCFVKSQEFELTFDEDGIGHRFDKETYWNRWDGLINFGEISGGVWTLQFHNGTVINIPADQMSEEIISFVKRKLG